MPKTITLAEIRKKYPQYDKVPDAQLASGLYKKFYAGKMSEDQFNQRIGFKPPAAPPKPPGLGDRIMNDASQEGAIARMKGDIHADLEDQRRRDKETLMARLKEAPANALHDLGEVPRLISDAARASGSPVAGALNANAVVGDIMHAIPGGDILAKGLQAMGPEAGALGEGAEAATAAARAPKALTPHLKAAQTLGAKGVQILGVPEDEALDNWLRHTYDKVLAPLKQTYPKGNAVGHPAVKYLRQAKDKAYDAGLEHAKGALDNELASKLGNLYSKAEKLGRKRLNTYLENAKAAIKQYNENGTIDGKSFKAVESDLRQTARGLRKAPKPKDRQLAQVLYELTDTLRENVYKYSPPGTAEAMKAADTTHALLSRVSKATVKAGVKERGRFTPEQLQQTVKEEDPSFQKGSFGSGDALLQDHANEGIDALTPPKKPLLAGLERRIPAWVVGGAAGEVAGQMFGGHVPYGLGRELGMGLGAWGTEPALRALSLMRGRAAHEALIKAAEETTNRPRTNVPAAISAGGAESDRDRNQ